MFSATGIKRYASCLIKGRHSSVRNSAQECKAVNSMPALSMFSSFVTSQKTLDTISIKGNSTEDCAMKSLFLLAWQKEAKRVTSESYREIIIISMQLRTQKVSERTAKPQILAKIALLLL